ncbi:MAG: HAMP domain-containing histidine kinase [Planctomycetaceae bacterium]|nr:HAMP domain-containing histidine kinase [Planctomycetaceae bacterium]MDG1808758.1 HAMP domain-containing sensor histidine kinase [Pirellulaceae bacterium]
MKLAGKLILLFVLIVVAVTAISSHFTSRQFLANARERHEQIAESINSESKQDSFKKAISTGDNFYFQQVVHTISPHAIEVRWVWLENNMPGKYRPLAEEQIPMLRESDHSMSLMEESEDGTNSLLTYCPIESEGKKGAIELSSQLTGFEQSRSIWLFGLLTICASALLGIAAVMTAGVRWIARPLSQLTNKMQRVGEGDFEEDLHIESKDELGQLAVAVNQMCRKLKSQQDTIQQKSEQKIKTLEQLRHADRLKTVGQLAAGLAHEVGTPLNVVSGRASMIIADPNMAAEKIKANAQTIKTEADRISSIIQKLMDFARRSPMSMVNNDLKDVIVRAVDLIGPMARSQNIRIEMRLPEQPAMAKFDFNQMQQVMMNLIDNAVDATPAGSAVCVELVTRQDQWVLSVSDQGPGITGDDQRKIFEPFFTTKEVGAGTGLGLSIVHGIVEEHGGKIHFESAGQGTTFIIELPRE